MPVVIFGTEMERGSIKWRAVTTGLEGDGPTDKTLAIKFVGDLARISGLNGQFLSIAEFRQTCSLAIQDWIPSEGIFQCSLTAGMTNLITVRFSET